jgi:hypothetical protein
VLTTRNVTRANMLNTLFVNTSGGTANARIISGIRLKRIEIYSTGQDTAISLEWLSAYGPTRELTDQSLTTASVACIRSSPPPQSVAGFWSMTGTNESEVLLAITTAGTATVVDVWVDMIMYDGESPVTVATSASGTIGQTYMSYFDGPGSGATFVPQSYTTIN